MAIDLFDPQLVIDRLGAQVATLKKVDGAAELAAAEENLKQVPAAFVLPLTERPDPNELATAVSQRDAVRFGVVLAVSNLRDTTGKSALEDLRSLRIAVVTALLGWAPGSGYDVVEYGGGQLLYLAERVLWWRDEFTTALWLRNI